MTQEEKQRRRCRDRYRKAHGIPLDAQKNAHFQGTTLPTARLRQGPVRDRMRAIAR